MKINFELDDNEPMFEILDAAFVGYMKKEIKTTKQMLKSPYYSHPDDIEQWKKNIEALKFLVKYYGG